MENYEFAIERSDLRKTHLHITKRNRQLTTGEVLFKIDKYAFTANNITYAILGNDLSYFKFFPAIDPNESAIVPVWGIGSIVESKEPTLEIGNRFYGYFPMASHLISLPGKVREAGFSDQTPHRIKLPAVYNFYSNLHVDELHKDEFEDLELVFRPLFTTSFLIDDYLDLNHFFDSDQIVITSASSKTAIALVSLLQLRKIILPNLRIIALTSQSNHSFVNSLGCYDEVYLYENVNEIKNKNTTIVDFSGNQKLISDLSLHLGSQLKFTSLVGLVQWEKRNQTPSSQIGTVFFAPHQVKKRAKEWGLDGFQEKVSKSWHHFMPFAQDKFQTETITNIQDIEKVYLKNLDGKVPPNSAYVIHHS